ncbi:putative adenylate kinase 7, mitochondrial, partial [Drosera capensis]
AIGNQKYISTILANTPLESTLSNKITPPQTHHEPPPHSQRLRRNPNPPLPPSTSPQHLLPPLLRRRPPPIRPRQALLQRLRRRRRRGRREYSGSGDGEGGVEVEERTAVGVHRQPQPQEARLRGVVGVPHISIGSLVRQELSPRSDLYKQIASAINQGKLVPENIIFGLLSNRLEEGYDRGETGFILEGIRRTRLQAEVLNQLADIDLVVNFKCCDGRIQGDRTCSDGCTPSHATKNPTTIGSKLSPDGSKPKVLAFYAEQRKLLEGYYRSQKKLIDFQVGSAFRDTWKGLLAVLHLPHFDVNHSPGHSVQSARNHHVLLRLYHSEFWYHCT